MQTSPDRGIGSTSRGDVAPRGEVKAAAGCLPILWNFPARAPDDNVLVYGFPLESTLYRILILS